MQLKLDDGVVEDVRFSGRGCAISQASASMLTETVKGMKLTDVAKLSKDVVLENVGHRHKPDAHEVRDAGVARAQERRDRRARRPGRTRSDAPHLRTSHWSAPGRAEPEFRALVRARRRFVTPATFFFIAYYLALPDRRRILAGGHEPAGLRAADDRLRLCPLTVCDGVDPACGLPAASAQIRFPGGAYSASTRRASCLTRRPEMRTQQTLVMFAIFVGITLIVTYWASGQSTTRRGFYAANRRIGGLQNGWAIAGEYFSAASFLGITGLIAFYGFDGFMYSVGWLVAYLAVLLLVAEPLRNTGKYTVADLVSFRLRGRGVRATAALSTLAITLFFLIAQMVGVSALVKLLLPRLGGVAAIIAVGVLMLVYVLFGGMLATTWVQIITAALLLSAALGLSLLVLAHYHFSLGNLLTAASHVSSGGHACLNLLQPGLLFHGAPGAWNLGIARSRARARHRRAAAHPDALLHGTVGAGRAHVGGVGDGADRRLLPVDVVHGSWRRDDRRQGAHRPAHVCGSSDRVHRASSRATKRAQRTADETGLHRAEARQQPRRSAAGRRDRAARC